jgi:hypothetical protein
MTAAAGRKRARHSRWWGAVSFILLLPAIGRGAQNRHRPAPANGARHGIKGANKPASARGKKRPGGNGVSTTTRWHPGLEYAFKMTGKRVDKR